MEVYLYFTVLSIIFLLIIRSLFYKSTHRNLPPGPVGYPILGSLLEMEQNVHQSLFRIAQRHGPLMTVRLGVVNTVVASSPEVAKEILGKYEPLFCDRAVPDAMEAQPNPEFTLAWVPGDHTWRNRRRVCTTHLFSPQGLNALQHLRHEKVQQLLRYIERKHPNTGEPVNIGNVVFATSLNLISTSILSADVVDPELENVQEFKDLVWRIMEDGAKPNLSDCFPALRRFDVQGIRKHIRASFDRLHEIFEEIIEKRLKDRAAGSTTRIGDFLDTLLDQCQVEGSGFNRLNIKALFVDFFVAGSDTTSITVEWAMTELLRNPTALQKLRQELFTVIGTDRPVQESDIDKLPYLQATFKEILRLHPPGPLLLYKAKTDTEVLGYTIPEGIRVIVNVWAILRDPNYWVEPLKFHPERFMGSNVNYKGGSFEYIPFGAGRRICPGMPLAGRMSQLVLASLLQAFTWRLPEGISPKDLDMEERFGIGLKKAIPLCAITSTLECMRPEI